MIVGSGHIESAKGPKRLKKKKKFAAVRREEETRELRQGRRGINRDFISESWEKGVMEKERKSTFSIHEVGTRDMARESEKKR